MDLRQAGIVYWPIVSLAGVVDSGDTGENENAWWACVLRAEEGGEEWAFV